MRNSLAIPCLRAAAILAAMAVGGRASATTKYYKNLAGITYWSNVANWSAVSNTGTDNAGPPTANNDAANLTSNDANQRTVFLDVNTPALVEVDISNAGTGGNALSVSATVTMTAQTVNVGLSGVADSGGGQLIVAGTANISNNLSVAGSTGSVGTFDLTSGSTLNMTGTGGVSPVLYLGYLGYGVAQSEGTAAIGGTVNIGYQTGGVGNFQQDAGSITIGTSSLAQSLYLGRTSGTYGYYTLSGQASLKVFGNEYVGESSVGFSSNGTIYNYGGSFTQSGGTHTVTGLLDLGDNAKATGSYALTGGSLTVAGMLNVGPSGSGSLQVNTAGTATVNGGLEIAVNAGSVGVVTLNTGGTVVDNNVEEHVGQSGAGTFNQLAGTHTVNQNLLLGVNAGGSGTYTQSGGMLTAGTGGTGYEFLGYNGSGTFNQSGGAHTVSGTLILGLGTNATGRYFLSDPNSVGTKLTLTGNEIVGVSAVGTAAAPASTFSQSGGTQVLGTATAPAGLVIAQGSGTFASYTLSNGAATVYGPIVVGENGSGTFTQTGGTLTDSGYSTALSNVGQTTGFRIGLSTGGSGTYVLQNGTANLPSLYVGASGSGTVSQTGGVLNVNGSTTVANGSITLAGGQASFVYPLAVSSGSSFAATGTAVATFFTPINVTAGGTFQLKGSSDTTVVNNAATKPAELINGFSIDATATLDLQNLSLDLPGASLATITTALAGGFDQGREDLPGIVSSIARYDTTHRTTVGVMQNNAPGTAAYTVARPFHSVVPGPADVLVAYTYFGDANLDGVVNGSDYALIDNSFNKEHSITGPATMISGWSNGDFNYDGVVDGSDYTLIDNTFNTQSSAAGVLPAALFATSADQIAGAPVPEPANFSLLAITAVKLIYRRPGRSRIASP